MKLDGIGSKLMDAGMVAQGNGTASVQRQIRMLQKELSQLEQKKELTREEAQKKQELEKQIAELKQQLQQIKADEKKEKPENEKVGEKDRLAKGRLEEEGKGANVDEFI